MHNAFFNKLMLFCLNFDYHRLRMCYTRRIVSKTSHSKRTAKWATGPRICLLIAISARSSGSRFENARNVWIARILLWFWLIFGSRAISFQESSFIYVNDCSSNKVSIRRWEYAFEFASCGRSAIHSSQAALLRHVWSERWRSTASLDSFQLIHLKFGCICFSPQPNVLLSWEKLSDWFFNLCRFWS